VTWQLHVYHGKPKGKEAERYCFSIEFAHTPSVICVSDDKQHYFVLGKVVGAQPFKDAFGKGILWQFEPVFRREDTSLVRHLFAKRPATEKKVLRFGMVKLEEWV